MHFLHFFLFYNCPYNECKAMDSQITLEQMKEVTAVSKSILIRDHPIMVNIKYEIFNCSCNVRIFYG